MKYAILAVSALLAFSLAPSTAIAQMKVIQFKDANKPALVGMVTERADTYEVTTPKGLVTVPVDQVASITDYVSPAEEFRKRQGSLSPTDAAGHYELAKWAYNKGLLEDSRSELELVLSLQNNNENAKLLLTLVVKAISEQKEAAATGKEMVHISTSDKPGSLLSQMMSNEDVQRVRRAELRSADRATIEFRNDVQRRYISAMTAAGRYSPADASAFYSKPPVAQAVEILTQSADPQIQEDILIKNDPAFMAMFKKVIWPTVVLRQCASPECHGAARGQGRLKLYPQPAQDDRVYYTNFYILESYEYNGNRMINRNAPEQSLMIQYGVPDSRLQHPGGPVPAMYRSGEDPRYQTVMNWITNVLVNPRPTYNLDYHAPVKSQNRRRPRNRRSPRHVRPRRRYRSRRARRHPSRRVNRSLHNLTAVNNPFPLGEACPV